MKEKGEWAAGEYKENLFTMSNCTLDNGKMPWGQICVLANHEPHAGGATGRAFNKPASSHARHGRKPNGRPTISTPIRQLGRRLIHIYGPFCAEMAKAQTNKRDSSKVWVSKPDITVVSDARCDSRWLPTLTTGCSRYTYPLFSQISQFVRSYKLHRTLAGTPWHCRKCFSRRPNLLKLVAQNSTLIALAHVKGQRMQMSTWAWI